ncbi:tetratricopeptide repeat protein [Candidatus Ichthyocystis sparus]|uniref:tetratricopeptide repeat protein n=1 Tax=Candidatus Ichthyocystis sparus TaxID=1561004 RepID=UPI000B87BF16|nr:tetratricopeptide repeat protein [Candidatus Ichthyocystis sparus]
MREKDYLNRDDDSESVVSGSEHEGHESDTDDDVMSLINHIFGGGTVSSFEGRSKESLDAMHFVALKMYNSGRYSEAHPIFHELVRLKHTEQEYMFGLAACLHKMGHYINAANVYLSALLLDLDADNFEIYFHMAQCLISAGKSLEQAKEYLEYVVDRAPQDGELGKLRSVAEAQLKLFNRNNKQSSVKSSI